MKFGLIFFASGEDQGETDKYRLVFESARFADAHGFSSLWIPERHFTRDGCLYPNPAVLQAAIARETRRIALRAGSVVLPLHHPVRVAEEWSVVDNLSGGRVGLSFASGWHPDDFIFAPERYDDRSAEMFRSIETVQRLWRGEEMSFPGGGGRESRVRIYPTPVQAEVPVWVTAAGSPETFQKAGRMGAHLLTHMFNQDPAELAGKVALYRAARAEAGFDPATGEVSVMLHAFVGADEGYVRDTARDAFCRYLKGASYLLKAIAASRDQQVDFSRLSERDMDEYMEVVYERLLSTRRVLFGTPEASLAFMAELRAAGVDEVACQMDFGVDTDAVLASLPELDRLRAACQGPAFDALVAAQAGDAPAAPARERVPALKLVRGQGLAAARGRCGEAVEVDAFYGRLAERGVSMEGSFRAVASLARGSGEALGEIIAELGEGAAAYRVHPAVLDACFQVLFAALPDDAADGALYLPSGMGSVKVLGRPGARAWSHAVLRPADPGAEMRVGDVTVYDEDGAEVVQVTGLALKRTLFGARAAAPSFGGWLYEVEWEDDGAARPAPEHAPAGTWLVLADRAGTGAELARLLEERGHRALVADTADVAARVAEAGPALSGIVHLAGTDGAEPAAARDLGCGVALQALNAIEEGGARLWLVTRGAQPAGGTGAELAVEQSPLWGLGRTIAQEAPGRWGGAVDLDPGADANTSAAQLLGELLAPGAEDQVAFRAGRRFVPRLVAGQSVPAATLNLDPAATYLVTGGTGELGLRVAERLARRGARRLVLVGRTALPPREVWEAAQPGSPAAARIDAIRALEALGAEVRVEAADVGDHAALAAVLEGARAAGWGPVRGVVHAAGVATPGALREISREALAAAFRPKVEGAWNLHRLLEGEPLDFFVLFSSWASFAGVLSEGLGGYGAANAFLDALARLRRARGLPAVSVDWGDWAEVGMRARFTREGGASASAWTIRPEQGLDAMEALALRGAAQVAVLPVEWAAWGRLFPRAAASPFFSRVGAAGAPSAAPAADGGVRAALAAAPAAGRPELVQGFLRERLGAVLGTPAARLDIHTPITALGLDSLMAVELKNRIESELGVVLPLATLFQGPSIHDLAGTLLAQAEGALPAAPALGGVEEGVEHPLSAGQRSLWFLHQLDPESAPFNVTLAARVASALDVPALERAFGRLAQRHAALRTAYGMRDGAPFQVVNAEVELPFQHVDAAGWSDEALRGWMDAEAEEPFDLEAGVLARASVFTRGAADHVLLLVVHHIATDFWSNTLLLSELVALYEAERTGEGPVPAPPAARYTDYVRWHDEMLAGPDGERLWGYWREELAGELPVLSLPTDHPRPPVQTYRGAGHPFALGPALTRRVKEFALERSTTLFTTLLAAYQVFLHRYTGQDDLVVASPAAGRSRAGFEGIVGYFMNPVVLRAQLGGAPAFEAFLERTRERVVGALEHQDFPAHLLVERLNPARDPSHSLLFQTLFVLNKPNRPEDSSVGQVLVGGAGVVRAGSLALEAIPFEEHSAVCDLALYLGEADGELTGRLQYNADLFEPASVARMAHNFAALLEALLDDPGASVAAAPLLAAPERELLLGDWARGPVSEAAEPLAHAAFEEAVLRDPAAVAVTGEDESLTYGELNERANRLARHLRALGVERDSVVGVCLERGPEMVVAVLAVLKAGGAYLPLDPAYPAERLLFMLGDTRAPVVVTRRRMAPVLAESGAEVVAMDADWPRIAREEAADLPHTVAGENLSYLIYTSGSTGTPKGTMVRHASLANHAWAAVAEYGVTADDRVLQFASLSFDASVEEIFPTLMAGAALVLRTEESIGSVGDFFRFVQERGVTILDLPTAYWHGVVVAMEGEGLALPDAVRLVIIGGERALPERVAAWRRLGTGARLVNTYGPTEATVVAMHHTVDEGDARAAEVPIGRYVRNARGYVLDAALNPVPAGVPGQLYLGGAGLARGYLGRPGLTARHFVPDPFSGEPGARLYATGDRVRYLEGGEAEFCGRVDEQVKIRGFRIEPGEVEATLATHPDVHEAVVVAREDAPAPLRLVAYATARPEGAPTARELREFLKEQLPDYMVPSAFVLLDELPKTRSGKVDRRALPAPGDDAGPREGYVAPRDPGEELLAGIWGQVLGRRVGVHDNFFELGGDSILGIHIVSRANQAGLRLTPRQLFQHQTVAGLAAAAGSGPALVAEQGMVTGALPLTPYQEWFFAERFGQPHHWNMAVLLEARRALDPTLLERALAMLLVQHDALRTRFVPGEGGWEQEIGADTAVTLERLDLADVPVAEQDRAVEAAAARIQTGLHLGEGPLFRAAWLELGAERAPRLFLTAHHMVVDGISWRVLLEDLQAAYVALEDGADVVLPRKTTSYRHWAERLRAYGRAGAAERELPYWLAPRGGVGRLPLDHAGSTDLNTEDTAETVTVSLSAEETRALLHDVPRALGTQVNDVLLLALCESLSAWTREDAVRVDLEGHGREDLFEDVDLARTVGCFTALFPVLLEARGGSVPERAAAVREQLRAIPNRGIGYGVLRYLGGDEIVAGQLAALPRAEVSFNYLGQFDQFLPEGSLFRAAEAPVGPVRSPGNHRSHLLEVLAATVDGRLRLMWTFSTRLHRGTTVKSLGDGFVASIRATLAHARNEPAPAEPEELDLDTLSLLEDELGGLVS